MNSTAPRPIRHLPLSLFLILVMGSAQGCGVVGPPLPPEDIGIEAKIRSQKQAETHTTENGEQQVVPLDQEDVTLPPIQPLGAQ